jgi:hypothetical protein
LLTPFLVALQYLTLPTNQVGKAHELWVQANARNNDRKDRNRKTIIDLEQEDDDPDADLTDINLLFAEKSKGPHMYELDFEPMEEEPLLTRAKTETIHWKWKHKFTGKVIKRYPTHSLRGWDLGKLGNYLATIKETEDKIAYQRAVQIIKLNRKDSKKGLVANVVVNRIEIVRQWVSFIVLLNLLHGLFANLGFLSILHRLSVLCL